jgi:predicted dithiol-disulfide oxidoreductase (DUF899 family)
MTTAIEDRIREIQQLEEDLLEQNERLAELKRQIPPVKVTDYQLKTSAGTVSLSDLFAGKPDLIVIHNMGKGCAYCTLWADGFNGVHRHLENRAGFAVVSPDPPAVQQEFAQSRGWKFRMASGEGSTFIEDMGFRGEKSWMPGVSTFHRDKSGAIVRIAKAPFGPGDPFCGVWHLLALLRDGAGDWRPKYTY